MSDFDYGNARLRAMKSRLLPRRMLESLTDAGSVQGLITALTGTVYREVVEAALVRLVDMECLAEALRNDLVSTIGKVRKFYSGPAGELAGLALRRYDLHNVKTVLRGLAGQVPANEILANTLPVADLRPADLSELARAANPRAAVDVLATWAVPLAHPLLAIRAARRDGGAELAAMELALDRWHLRSAMPAAREADADGKPLLDALMVDADVTNVLTALRLVGAPDALAMVRQRYGTDEVAQLFVGPGHVPFALLTEAARQSSITEAVNVLGGTGYGLAMAGARDQYASTGRLSVFERALALRQLRHAAALLIRDPLGIGVLLGYVALKTNEVSNLRAIAQGLMLGEKPERIRAELMFR